MDVSKLNFKMKIDPRDLIAAALGDERSNVVSGRTKTLIDGVSSGDASSEVMVDAVIHAHSEQGQLGGSNRIREVVHKHLDQVISPDKIEWLIYDLIAAAREPEPRIATSLAADLSLVGL